MAILTLGIGIGSTTALFSIVQGVLLARLPYREADRLAVVLTEREFEGAQGPVSASFPWEAMTAWPSRGGTFERVGFYAQEVAALLTADASELIDTAVVSGTFFETLSGEFVLGRGLLPADDTNPVVVISERLWRRLFAGDPGALGRQLVLSGRTYSIVGVARHTFEIPQPRTDAWLPAGFAHMRNAACCWVRPIVRLAPHVEPEAVRQEVTTIVDTQAAQFPRALAGARVQVATLRDQIVGDTRDSLLVLGAAVGLLFLLACANVANLLGARGTARAHETSIRRALGASRGRILMQRCVESALLALAGGALGVVVAAVSIRAAKSGLATHVPRLDVVQVDSQVLLFGLLLSVISTVAATVLPAFQRNEPSHALAIRQRGIGGTPATRLPLRALTIVQLAISVVLLVSAALLGRSLIALLRTDTGVTAESVATASLNLAMTRTLTDTEQIELVNRVVDRVGRIPTVTAAGAGTARPPDASRMALTLKRADRPSASYRADGVPVTPGYFRTLGIRLERGRFFTADDDRQSPPVVILSADAGRRLFGENDPVGRQIALPVLRDGKSGSEEMTVVGVASTVKYSGLERAANDVVYRPFAQQAWRSIFLVARTTADPEVLASQLRREVGAVDPAITVGEVTTLEKVLSDLTAGPKFRTLILTALSAMAILIASIGVYGVIAYSVTRRTAEIGLRMALGADRRRIRMMVLWEGAVLALAGGALGLAGAFGLAKLLRMALYGIAPTDPVSYALAGGGMIAAALLVSLVPAERAARADPLMVMRAE